MANTILRVETSNTFDQWRIVTNSLVTAANDLRNNTYIKDSGGFSLSNGSIVVTKGNIQVVNGTLQVDRTSGESFYVVADGRFGGSLAAGNVTAVSNISAGGTINAGSRLFVAGINVESTLANAYGQANVATGIAVSAYGQANAAYAIANTVSVSFGGTNQVTNKQLNFNNTANIVISSSSGTGSNVNISFDLPTTIPKMTVSELTAGTLTYGYLVGPAQSNTDSYVLRFGLPHRGDGSFGVNQGGANGNAFIRFSASLGNVWQVTANSIEGTYYNIITSQNVSSSVTSTSTTNVASSSAVRTAFEQGNSAYAQANTALNKTLVSANNGTPQTNVGLNFNNTSTTIVSVGSGTTGNANVSIRVIPTFTTQINTTSTIQGTGEILVSGSTPKLNISSSGLTATMQWNSTTGTTDNNKWNMWMTDSTGSMRFQPLTDASAGGTTYIDYYRDGSAFTGAYIKTASSIEALKITQNGPGYALFVEDILSDSTPFFISNNGTIVSGTTVDAAWVDIAPLFSSTPRYQAHSNTTAFADASFGAFRWKDASSTLSSGLFIARSANSNIGSHSAITSGMPLGEIRVAGSNGSAFVYGATIAFDAEEGNFDGTSSVQTSINLKTTPKGATYPLSRMTIDSNGKTIIQNGPLVVGSSVGPRDNSTSIIYTKTRVNGLPVEYSNGYLETGFSVTAQETAPGGVFFKPDGSLMYISGATGDDITQYSLSTPWDVTTATHQGQSASLASQDTNIHDLTFSADGSNVYVIGTTSGNVSQFSLSSSWNVLTLTSATSNLVASYNVYASDSTINTARGLTLSDDGKFLYVAIGLTTGPKILQYSLSTPWNIGTATYVANSGTSTIKDLNGGSFSATSIQFLNNGSYLLLKDDTNDGISFHTLETPWQISSGVTTTGFVPTVTNSTGLAGIYARKDGKLLFELCSVTDTVNVYRSTATTTSLSVLGDTDLLGDVDVAGNLQVDGNMTITGSVSLKGINTLDTAVKTSNFNAEASKRYLANTTAAAITMTLPSSPTAGDIVSVVDYARTFGTKNLTVARNTKLIMGLSEDLVCDIAGTSIDLLYTDTVRGWILI